MWLGARAAAHCWGQGATPIGRVQGGSACAVCRGGEPLLRCPEVENLGPGKVDACVNLYWVYYLTQIPASVAASCRQICPANEKKFEKTGKELLKKNQN